MIGRRRTGEENRIAITPQSNSGGSPCRPRSAPTTPTRSCCPRTCATGCPRKTWPIRSRTLVDAALDLKAFYAPYEGDGRRNRPYEPALMVKLLLYGYASGTFSSRRIARARQRDIGFRYRAAGNTPAPRTICEFRRRHLGDFANLFVPVVKDRPRDGPGQFRDPGALDGSKVKASASRRKAMSYDRMLSAEKRLRAEIAGLLERAAAAAWPRM